MLNDTPREVTVMVYVDGVLYDSLTRSVPDFAVAYAVAAAVVQIDEPDLEAAAFQAQAQGQGGAS